MKGQQRRRSLLRPASGGERCPRGVSLFRQRTRGAIVIAILAALPVSGPLCSALCAPAVHADSSAAPGGHQEASECHDRTGDGAVVSGGSRHDCSGHNGAAGVSLASLSASRADVGLIGLVLHPDSSVPHDVLGLTPLDVRARPGAPTPSPPSTRTPLVLRI